MVDNPPPAPPVPVPFAVEFSVKSFELDLAIFTELVDNPPPAPPVPVPLAVELLCCSERMQQTTLPGWLSESKIRVICRL